MAGSSRLSVAGRVAPTSKVPERPRWQEPRTRAKTPVCQAGKPSVAHARQPEAQPRAGCARAVVGQRRTYTLIKRQASDGQKEKMNILACSSAYKSARKHAKHAQYISSFKKLTSMPAWKSLLLDSPLVLHYSGDMACKQTSMTPPQPIFSCNIAKDLSETLEDLKCATVGWCVTAGACLLPGVLWPCGYPTPAHSRR